MKQLKDIITEKLRINKNIKFTEEIVPKTKEELRKEILNSIKEKDYDLNNINVSNITDMSHLFEGIDNMSKIDISEWDVSNVETMAGMFQDCRYIQTTGDLSKWNISKCKDMSFMFNGCTQLRTIGDISNWPMDETINVKCMFQECKKLKTLGDIYHWKLSSPNWDVFNGAYSLKTFPRKGI